MKTTEQQDSKTSPQEVHLEKHDDLGYINDILKELPIKKLRYIETLVRNHMDEKRARHTMNNSGKQKIAELQNLKEPSPYDIQREEENDYV